MHATLADQSHHLYLAIENTSKKQRCYSFLPDVFKTILLPVHVKAPSLIEVYCLTGLGTKKTKMKNRDETLFVPEVTRES